MRRVDLELLVQKAVESLRAGKPFEDDRVEFKAAWPEPTKARQMAGAANALRGEPLVYVIGVNEKTGEIQPLAPTEPGEWYAGFRRGFDSTAPQLVYNVNVAVGDGPGEWVVALLFETDEFPYVMPVKDKPNLREVPVRVGTTTESANRRQLMRILAPVVQSPPTEIVEASATAELRDHRLIPAEEQHLPNAENGPAHRDLTIRVNCSVYVEHVAAQSVAIRERTISCALFVADRKIDLSDDLRVRQLQRTSAGGFFSVGSLNTPDNTPEPIPPTFGVYAQHGSIVATGPGEFSFWTEVEQVFAVGSTDFAKIMEELTEHQQLDLEVSFKFAAAESPVTLRCVLHATTPMSQPPPFSGNPSGSDGVTGSGRTDLRTWEFIDFMG